MDETLGVNGDADAAMIARIHSGWFKFCSLIQFSLLKMPL